MSSLARSLTLPPPANSPWQLDEGVFAVVLQAHRREGYEAGYRRALVDILSASVFIAEKALRDSEAHGEARRVLYRFVELLEAETLRFKREESFTEGAGI